MIACCPQENQSHYKEVISVIMVNHKCLQKIAQYAETYMFNWLWGWLSHFDGLKILNSKIDVIKLLCEFITFIAVK